MGSEEIQRRRRNLMRIDPHCYDCGIEVIYFKTDNREPLPDNFATVEHVNSRIAYPSGRPAKGKQILLCLRCNQNRAAAEMAQLNQVRAAAKAREKEKRDRAAAAELDIKLRKALGKPKQRLDRSREPRRRHKD